MRPPSSVPPSLVKSSEMCLHDGRSFRTRSTTTSDRNPPFQGSFSTESFCELCSVDCVPLSPGFQRNIAAKSGEIARFTGGESCIKSCDISGCHGFLRSRIMTFGTFAERATGKSAKGKNFRKLRGRKKCSQEMFQKISQKMEAITFTGFLEYFWISVKVALKSSQKIAFFREVFGSFYPLGFYP